MFLIAGLCFLALLSITLLMLWAHEKITNTKVIPRAKVSECWISEERRQHARFENQLDIEYGIEKKPHLKNGKTLNISSGGMKLELDEKLPEGAVMYIKFYVPGSKKAVEIEASVIWTHDAQTDDRSGKRYFNSGVKFIAIKEPSDAHFSEYIESLKVSGQ
jgi:c-di-GMP-binding flagellar brake protein YcgR